MKNEQVFQFNNILLREITDASLVNAAELSKEAILICENGHYARSYFLSVSAIEETGKAQLAFDAMNRNFPNPSIHVAIRNKLENHFSKTISAFVGWIHAASNKKNAIRQALALMGDLGIGREKSMYVDISSDGLSITEPITLVNQKKQKIVLKLLVTV